jgi:hypothetical protein
MSGRLRKSLRLFGALLTIVIVLWWTHDHVLLPNDAYNRMDKYLPDLDIEVPSIRLDHHSSTYNKSKVALLMDNRKDPLLAPTMLHFISVVPPDWKFRFLGSPESVEYVNRSSAIRHQVAIGKLDLDLIPANMSIAGQELLSQFMTNLWVYEVLLQPAEWLLVYQTDSKFCPVAEEALVLTRTGTICANSVDSVDNYLDYDWVGAPWDGNARYGGNGGLSLRRVSSIIKVLKHQHRVNDTEGEDVWLTDRLGHLPNYRTADGQTNTKFSAEQYWAEKPMGYHIGAGGTFEQPGLFGTQEKREKMYKYCPDVKMASLIMDVEAMMGNEFCNQDF